MTFGFPERLLLLAIVPVLAFTAARRRPPATAIPGIPSARNAAGRSLPLRARAAPLLPLAAEVLGLILLIVAWASPRLGAGSRVEAVESLDIFLALDVSGSMGAYDPPPGFDGADLRAAIRNGTVVTRCEGMRRVLTRFVRTRTDDRLGLIVFARRPYLACPLTEDREFLLSCLDDAVPGLVPDGTGLAGPILQATRLARDASDGRAVLILFTDGENNIADPASPEGAAAAAAAFGLTIYTVGIGSERAVIEIPGLVAERYAAIDTKPDDDRLRRVAEATGGFYFRAFREADFLEAVERIDAIERNRVQRTVPVPARRLDVPTALCALVLFLTAGTLRHTRFLRIP